MGRYIDPLIDYGFKYIFGREESKPLLIDLLNQILASDPGFRPIVKLEYRDKEKSRIDRDARGVIYDIHCETSDGKRFIVEMQNYPQPYFRERAKYYGAKGVVDQGRPGDDWRYDYLPVICVSLMNFTMRDFPDQLVIDGALYDRHSRKLISDKERYIFIQMPLFRKVREEDCVTGFDRWLYNILNMSTMERIAFKHENKLFKKLDEVAAYASMTREERDLYDSQVKAARDRKGQLEYAEMEGMAKGMAKGIAKGRAEVIVNMASQGLAYEMIAKFTGLPLETVKNVLSQNPS